MAEKQNKKTFIFNCSWQEVLMEYPPEVRLEVYDAVVKYAASGKLSEMKPLSKMAFSFIKKELDYNKEKYNEICEKRSRSGKDGAAKRWSTANKDDKIAKMANAKKDNKNSKCHFAMAKIADIDNENEYENVNENVNEKDNVACATTRARSEVLSIGEIEKEIINAESKAETLQMLYRISKEDYESIRDEILAEWKFRDYANTLSDAMQHFVNLVRVKAKSLKRPPNVPAKELSGRQRDFWQQVQSFAERYDEEMLKAFYAKWAEADAFGRYMKWELEDGFDMGKRLAKFHAYWSKT